MVLPVLVTDGTVKRAEVVLAGNVSVHLGDVPSYENLAVCDFLDDSEGFDRDSLCALSVSGFDGDAVAGADGVTLPGKGGLVRVAPAHLPVTSAVKGIFEIVVFPSGTDDPVVWCVHRFAGLWFSECVRATANDPKLSDGRGWRDRCVAGERRRQEAAGVTAAPVRCSAWLAHFVGFIDVTLIDRG